MEKKKLPSEFIKSFTENSDLIEVTEAKIQKILDTDWGFGIEQAELLRRLAIVLEREDFLDGWTGFRKIYLAAEKANPKNAKVLHSWAISAMEWIDDLRTPELQERVRIAEDAEQAILRAESIVPDDSGLIYSKGLLYYNWPFREESNLEWVKKALQCFEKSSSIEPNRQMARLYLAHCYQDLKNWESAYLHYSQVDFDALLSKNPQWRWRKLKRDEQLALCAARIGKILRLPRQLARCSMK